MKQTLSGFCSGGWPVATTFGIQKGRKSGSRGEPIGLTYHGLVRPCYAYQNDVWAVCGGALGSDSSKSVFSLLPPYLSDLTQNLSSLFELLLVA